MKIIRPAMLVAVCVFALISCSKDNPASAPVPSPQIFPLAFGNEWVYHILSYRPDGTSVYDGYDTLQVTDTTVGYGKHVFIALHDGRPANTEVFFNSGDTLYDLQTDALAVPRDTSISLLIYPTPLGKNIVLEDSVGADSTVYYSAERLDSTNAIVNAGFQSFTCLKFRSVIYLNKTFDVDSTIEYDYYTLGVGRILTQVVIPDGKGGHYLSTTYELQGYTLH